MSVSCLPLVGTRVKQPETFPYFAIFLYILIDLYPEGSQRFLSLIFRLMNVLDQPDHVTTDQTNIEGQGEENLRNTDS